MESYQFWTLVGMMAGGFGWMIHKMTELGERVTRLEEKISSLDGRVTRLEAMMQTVISFLLGNKTGTDK